MKTCGKIFLLDDDAMMLKMYATFLSGYGLDVFATDNAYKMILYAREMHPSVIVIDVQMPVLNGWQVLEFLKSDVKLKDIPVIMLTYNHEVKKAIALGVAGFLLKPVEPKKLLETVEVYCEYEPNPVVWMNKDTVYSDKKDYFVK